MKKEPEVKVNKKLKDVDFAGMLIGPHKKVSREVTKKDVKRVIKDAHDMYNICYTKVGIYNGFLGIAHPQITNKKPLRFFVTKDAQLIVNPKIIRHTKVTVDSPEGCATFNKLKPVIVQRWNKCDVEYQTIEKGDILSRVIFVRLSGIEAKVFQHEIQHLDGSYIFDV